MRATLVLGFALMTPLASGCKPRDGLSTVMGNGPSNKSCPADPYTRDWQRYPAMIELSDTTRTVYVMGDVHGNVKGLAKTLSQVGLITSTDKEWTDYRWSAGASILVLLGDFIDKGNDSVDVLRLVMALEAEATEQGGRVIALAGNHEMAFLADPFGSKAQGLRASAQDSHLDVCKDLYAPGSSIGGWLRQLPGAAIVNGIYMSHSGWAGGQNREEFKRLYQQAADAAGTSGTSQTWDTTFTCGDHQAGTPGFVNAEVWWGKHGKELDAQTAALGVTQVLFGHDPGAFGSHGKAKGYFGTDNDPGASGLIKLDVDMWEDNGDPALYYCKKWRPGGGCIKPHIFVRSSGKATLDDADKLDIKSDRAPDQNQPDARDGC